LYGEKAIEHIARFYSKKPAMIIFDPPRSGLKNIGEFVAKFQPEKFIFVACDFSSFTRDCKPMLDNYLLDEVHIFDLFPGTHHFETVGIFTKRS
jgi:23S rRNA (uracil1939-C5)-methyltransferase